MAPGTHVALSVAKRSCERSFSGAQQRKPQILALASGWSTEKIHKTPHTALKNVLCKPFPAAAAVDAEEPRESENPRYARRPPASADKFRARHFDGVDELEDRPLITQFCGNNPDTVVRAARHIENRCDAVDLNLGCPQKIAKKGNYGAFLLSKPQLCEDIVATMSRYGKFAERENMQLHFCGLSHRYAGFFWCRRTHEVLRRPSGSSLVVLRAFRAVAYRCLFVLFSFNTFVPSGRTIANSSDAANTEHKEVVCFLWK